MSTQKSLSASADERKARLAKLASLKRKTPGSDTTISISQDPLTQDPSDSIPPPSDSTSVPAQPNPYISGRNYDPLTRSARLGFDASSTLLPAQKTVEAQSTTLLNETLTKAAEEEASLQARETSDTNGGAVAIGGGGGGGGGLDLFKLQPKKPNWDLKRELDERMRRYDVDGKTKRAIAALVRDRVERNKREATLGGLAGKGKEGGERQGVVEGGVEGEEGAEEVGIDGAELVEGVKLREREDEEERLKEREEEREEDGVS